MKNNNNFYVGCCRKFHKYLWKADSILSHVHINLFVPNALFLYPLKTSENLMVFCFQGVETGFMGNKWVNVPDIARVFIALTGN